MFRKVRSTPAARSPGTSVAPDPRRGKMTRRGVTTIIVAAARMRSGVPTEGGAGAASTAVLGWLAPDPPQEEAGRHSATSPTARSPDLAEPATRGRYRRDGQLDAGAVLSSPRGAGGSDGAPTGP